MEVDLISLLILFAKGLNAIPNDTIGQFDVVTKSKMKRNTSSDTVSLRVLIPGVTKLHSRLTKVMLELTSNQKVAALEGSNSCPKNLIIS